LRVHTHTLSHTLVILDYADPDTEHIEPPILLCYFGGNAGKSTMPTDWADKVRDAIIDLELKTDRVLEPDQALAIIDDVVEGKFAAGDLATIHGIPQAWIRTALGHITRVVGPGRVRSLATGDWYERKSDDRPYDVAPGFAAAWKEARGLS
jgi:hypothetical protein